MGLWLCSTLGRMKLRTGLASTYHITCKIHVFRTCTSFRSMHMQHSPPICIRAQASDLDGAYFFAMVLNLNHVLQPAVRKPGRRLTAYCSHNGQKSQPREACHKLILIRHGDCNLVTWLQIVNSHLYTKPKWLSSAGHTWSRQRMLTGWPLYEATTRQHI